MAIRGLPAGPRRRAFAALLDHLQTDPTLKAVVRGWYTPDNPADDDALPSDVVSVRLSRGGGSWSAVASVGYSRTYEVQMRVAVEIRVPGDHDLDADDVWDHISDRCTGRRQPDDEARRLAWDRLAAAGVMDVQPTSDPAGAAPGVITLFLQIED